MSYKNNAISSDDPKAIEKLTEKLQKCEELQTLMKTSLDKGTQRKTTENELPSLTQCTA